MNIITKTLFYQTRGENDILDITEDVTRELNTTKMKNGIVTIFIPGSTGAITTIEYEPGLLLDLPNTLEKIAPRNLSYEHEKRWHDGNGHSHVRASLIGPSLTVPFADKALTLGTWQQIVFLELDARNRRRKIILQIMGE
ncbi:MAG: secondary thiamine-phosphate synthase enzyme [miscellaneous Crenarchaeota group-6 archaeon AD8-1]|nr:MAG: secondary thiamine-phosphate synthase enzyme [miscellaneous Crenarchaeota group-6 archaeon AD8-1]